MTNYGITTASERWARLDKLRKSLDDLEFVLVDLVDDQVRNGYHSYVRYTSMTRRKAVVQFFDIADALTPLPGTAEQP